MMAPAMRTEQEMIAYALEIDPALFRFVPQLLADLEELGSDAGVIVDAIAGANVPPGARVLDLGCGKGAVSIAIARALGLNVTGIDLFEPFIAGCSAAATAAGVAELCSFRRGNIATLAGTIPPAQVAVFAALGDVLGPLGETVGILRALVEPGGCIVISDAFVTDGLSPNFPGFEACLPLAETRARLQSHGDTIEREILDDEADRPQEAALIRARAEALAAKHPAHRDALLEYATAQEDEYAFIEENLRSATWVIRTKPA